MDTCIRCGECHEFCPQDAIRHDGDLTEWRIGQAVRRVEECMAACQKVQDTPQAAQNCLERFMRHYRNERRIIDEVVKRISGFEEPSGEDRA
jgi:ferredoxin